MKKLVLLVCFLVLVSGCAGVKGVGKDSGPVIPSKITLQSVPMILDPSQVPPSALDNGSVAGVDVNLNGIRDDVELWIARTYPGSAKLRAAAAQVALSLQRRTTTPGLTRESAYLQGVEAAAAVCCLADSQPKITSGVLQKLMAVQLNTRGRANAYVDFERIFGGRVMALPDDGCAIPASLLPD